MPEKQPTPTDPELVLKCMDCGHDFVFEPGERAYYKKNGLQVPKRCSACRWEKRRRYEEK